MKVFTFTGCIAVGKTTMAKTVAEKFKYPFINEEADENPYLGFYYKDMAAFAFKMQSWYLSTRITQFLRLREYPIVVQDQMLHAFAFIYPSLQLKSGFLTEKEYDGLLQAYNLFYEHNWILSGGLDEIILYLRVKKEDIPQLMDRIKIERARACESCIEPSYLEALIEEYEKWFKNSNKRIIELDPIRHTVEENIKIVEERISDENFNL